MLCRHASSGSGIGFANFLAEMDKDRLAIAADNPGFGLSDQPCPDFNHFQFRLRRHRSARQLFQEMNRDPVHSGWGHGAAFSYDFAINFARLKQSILAPNPKEGLSPISARARGVAPNIAVTDLPWSDIGDSWAIGRGRYIGAGPMNQRVLSTMGKRKWSTAMPHALRRQLGEGNA